MIFRQLFLIFSLFLTLAQYSQARVTNYLAPSEQMPQDAEKLYAGLPEGALVGVGTERLFFAAAQSPRVSHLVGIDNDPEVLRYNIVNMALLDGAKDMVDYRNLRLNSSAQIWEQAALNAKDPEHRSVLRDPQLLSWWQSVMRNPHFANMHSTDANKFGEANYLFHDQAFRRVRHLARNKAYQFKILDLKSTAEFSRELNDINEKHGIAAVDLSNVWQPGYLKQSTLNSILRIMKMTLGQESVLIFTSQEVQVGARGLRWVYLGVNGAYLRDTDGVGKTLKALENISKTPGSENLVLKLAPAVSPIRDFCARQMLMLQLRMAYY